jgi:hypothetical protein
MKKIGKSIKHGTQDLLNSPSYSSFDKAIDEFESSKKTDADKAKFEKVKKNLAERIHNATKDPLDDIMKNIDFHHRDRVRQQSK